MLLDVSFLHVQSACYQLVLSRRPCFGFCPLWESRLERNSKDRSVKKKDQASKTFGFTFFSCSSFALVSVIEVLNIVCLRKLFRFRLSNTVPVSASTTTPSETRLFIFKAGVFGVAVAIA